jgi:hypothetical protein
MCIPKTKYITTTNAIGAIFGISEYKAILKDLDSISIIKNITNPEDEKDLIKEEATLAFTASIRRILLE